MICLSIVDQIAVLAAPVSVDDLAKSLLTTGSLSDEMLVLPVGAMEFPLLSSSRKPKPFGQSAPSRPWPWRSCASSCKPAHPRSRVVAA